MSNIRYIIQRAALFSALALTLQGCVEMAVGTAVVATMVATDRRTVGAQTEDAAILLKGASKIASNYPDAHVNLTSFNRKVLLTGQVKDEATKQAIEREFATIEAVQSVANEIEINFTSSLTSRANDTLIDAKVKASIVNQKRDWLNVVKVVTENGTVYLMGRVTQSEAAQVSDIAAGVSGVKKVVKVFDYLSEEELTRISKGF
jgi:osmotically-inducible protein OsmY